MSKNFYKHKNSCTLVSKYVQLCDNITTSLNKNVREEKNKIHVMNLLVALIPTSTSTKTHRALATLQLPASLRETLNLEQNCAFKMT